MSPSGEGNDLVVVKIKYLGRLISISINCKRDSIAQCITEVRSAICVNQIHLSYCYVNRKISCYHSMKTTCCVNEINHYLQHLCCYRRSTVLSRLVIVWCVRGLLLARPTHLAPAPPCIKPAAQAPEQPHVRRAHQTQGPDTSDIYARLRKEKGAMIHVCNTRD